ncbi:type II toxin-antitoxin system PemK/MazF family toxin [Aurantimonas sp. MSK8Z-1]|uniref:type II toxin-antitoxin system PemK/MazF family toxin n=1 Tax=Mangrovibrevibacter kandeliae TaxID=2968473 RepID=UPI002118DAC5|nr:type II toxin-antitoxin system PemK/MazF family toxin [Aurantimonas sp. MSK8Z-1]MCW4113672.1 type II toxin-antitoxin system PemK/MazF family toxin [Aurantimonas sp. MSK8Z-1]
MRRGDVVIVALAGDYGKARPAVVLQNDRLDGRLDSVVIALRTTFDEGARVLRIAVDPTTENGPEKSSRIMVNKLYSLPSHRVREAIGHLDDETMLNVDRALLMLLALDPLRATGDSSPAERDKP